MKQVYLDQNISVNDVICLDTKQAHHIFDVLRTTQKEKIRIITKNSGVFFGHVENKPNLVIDLKVDVFKENQSITVCIGPEGGFEESEIQILNDFGYDNCSLGKNILRAETAACFVLSAIEYQNHVEG